MLLLAAAPDAASAPGASPGGYPADDQVAQLMLQQQVVVRMQRPAPARPIRPLAWKEKKGPKCVSLDDLAGALVSQPNSVDLVLRGGDRFRARFEKDCPPLDFYSGFYLKAAKDGQVCAGRDAVRSRSGRMCAVDKFRRLVADR